MAGIDYGSGLTNIDVETGIRYGVIHHNEVGQAWYDDAESEYGDPTCPECGSSVVPSENATGTVQASEWFTGKDYYCRPCQQCFWSDSVFGDEPIAFSYSDAEYICTQGGSDCDIFILKSPYYTLCSFCSPCAPGAGYLTSPDVDGVKAYRFGPEWFEDGNAPYVVYRVSDNSIIKGDKE